MTNRKVARKYNLALYLTAEDMKVTGKVKHDFADILRSIAGSKELTNFLLTPVISAEKKAAVIKALFEGKVDGLTLKFMEFLCEKNRIDLLTDIADDFVSLVNEKQGIVPAKIKTAIELSDSEKRPSAINLKLSQEKKLMLHMLLTLQLRAALLQA